MNTVSNSNEINAKKSGKAARILAATAVATAALASIGTSRSLATPVNTTGLSDKNSSLSIDYNPNTLPATPNGVENWTVDGTNVLNREWFWSRVNGGTASSINNFTETTIVSPTDIIGDGGSNYTQLQFVDPNNPLKIDVGFALVGGASGSKASDLSETILITNTGSTAMNYDFFMDSDFSLGGTPSGETASITGGNTAKVTKPGGLQFAETVVSPKPLDFEADASPLLLNKLDNTSNLTLDNNATATTISGDAEWGFQWDLQLKPGASYVISVDKQVSATAVPEPASGLAIVGVSGVLLSRRRRNAARR